MPAYAGVPLTHRDLASAFAVVTGHEAPERPESSVDWNALAQVPTLVILMGLKRSGSICAALLAAGRAPDTPAVAISWGTTDQQQVVRSNLHELPAAVADGTVYTVGRRTDGEARTVFALAPDGSVRWRRSALALLIMILLQKVPGPCSGPAVNS